MRSGRVVNVTSNGALVGAIDGPLLAEDEADTWTIAIQTVGAQQANVATNAIVQYWVGNAPYKLQPIPVGASLTKLLVNGRKVQVDLQPAVGDNVSTTAWAVSVSRGGSILGPESGGSWIATAVANANNYNIFSPGFGRVFAAQANVVNFNAAASGYILLFDTTAAPGNGNAPIAGGRSSLVTPGGPSTDFGGTFTPLVFNKGLWVALSSTPDVLTLIAGGTFTFDAFVSFQ